MQAHNCMLCWMCVPHPPALFAVKSVSHELLTTCGAHWFSGVRSYYVQAVHCCQWRQEVLRSCGPLLSVVGVVTFLRSIAVSGWSCYVPAVRCCHWLAAHVLQGCSELMRHVCLLLAGCWCWLGVCPGVVLPPGMHWVSDRNSQCVGNVLGAPTRCVVMAIMSSLGALRWLAFTHVGAYVFASQ
jgi:hypothetical protein